MQACQKIEDTYIGVLKFKNQSDLLQFFPIFGQFILYIDNNTRITQKIGYWKLNYEIGKTAKFFEIKNSFFNSKLIKFFHGSH